MPRILKRAGCLLIASSIWLPLLHLFFRPSLSDFRLRTGIALEARRLLARQMSLWDDASGRRSEITRMRQTNAEWDFMGRTYLALALANIAVADPAEENHCLAVIDGIIDETLQLEQSKGVFYFTMDYARDSNFIQQPPRSTFLDGEIALMLAARQTVCREPRYAALLAQRVDVLEQYMSRGPVMCGESYPDECWMFCNSVAIAAIRMSDRLDGRDHGPFIRRWLYTIKSHLIDRGSGLLISRFTFDGRAVEGPEGSSIWMVAHCLKLVDPAFAAGQFRLARQQLGAGMLGFGYAHEWPTTWKGLPDVDSGPIIPLLNLSPGSSGLAILGAATFGDDDYLRDLLTTLRFAGFPTRRGNQLRFSASNQVGDAVLLYALVQGPLWDRVAMKPSEDKR